MPVPSRPNAFVRLVVVLLLAAVAPTLRAEEFGLFSYRAIYKGIVLPATFMSLGNDAFGDCDNLTSIVFLGPRPTLHSGLIENPPPGFTVYYVAGTPGFTSPRWLLYDSVAILPDSFAWLESHGFDNRTDLNSDPDGDGINLLTAYALDLDPNTGTIVRLTPERTTTSLGVAFYAGRTDVTYLVETSDDLQTWTTSGITLSDPTPEQWRTARINHGDRPGFLRLTLLKGAPEPPVPPGP